MQIIQVQSIQTETFLDNNLVVIGILLTISVIIILWYVKGIILIRWFEVGAICIGLFTLYHQYREFQLANIEREQETIARAWQILTTVAPGNSGKREALELLSNKGISLRSIDLSCQKHGTLLSLSSNGFNKDKNFNHNRCQGAVYLYGLNLHVNKLHNKNYVTDITGSRFQYANLENGNFSDVIINEVDFSYTNLRNSIFIYTNSKIKDHLENVNFTGANLINVEFSNIDVFSKGNPARFHKSLLMDATFKHSELWEADFSDANLFNTSFDDVYINSANFTGAYVKKTNFKNTYGLEKFQLALSWVWADTQISNLPQFPDEWGIDTQNRGIILFCDPKLKDDFDTITQNIDNFNNVYADIGKKIFKFKTRPLGLPGKVGVHCKRWHEWSNEDKKNWLAEDM